MRGAVATAWCEHDLAIAGPYKPSSSCCCCTSVHHTRSRRPTYLVGHLPIRLQLLHPGAHLCRVCFNLLRLGQTLHFNSRRVRVQRVKRRLPLQYPLPYFTVRLQRCGTVAALVHDGSMHFHDCLRLG